MSPALRITPETVGRQFWEAYLQGDIYPSAYCDLRTWQAISGKGPEDWPACPPDIARQLSAKGYTPERMGYEVGPHNPLCGLDLASDLSREVFVCVCGG